MKINQNILLESLARQTPQILRWAGAVACRMRGHNIAIGGKSSGFSNTDALTLADLSAQELLVDALRDLDPLFRECRIEAEETTGDLDRFAGESEYVFGLDPIDGTKQYRDQSGDGWSVMLHLRRGGEVLYSLVFIPQAGPDGRWVEVGRGGVRVGDDDPSLPARESLDALPIENAAPKPLGNQFYLIGFVGREAESVEAVSKTGLQGVDADDTPGCLYDLMASGRFGGSLIHSPNIYDYPVSAQIARYFGGDSVYVRTGEPVDFRDLWLDESSGMWRVKGIVATAIDPTALPILCDVARDWSEDRYAGARGAE